MKKFALCLALLLFALPAFAAAPVAAKLSPNDQQDLRRIESYLNNLKNFSADFIQVDEAGGIMHGVLDVSRPGKMRVRYDAPNKDFIIADGTFVHIWDDSLKSQTNVPQNSSLAEFILRDPVSLTKNVTVTKFQRFSYKMEITLVQTDDPGAGNLTLVFEDNPLQLRQWKVVDAQNRETGVSLQNMAEVAHFERGTFAFIPPSFGLQ